jgi:hypothetical protein
MPVHDWTRVDPGTFHAFHTLWIGELMKALNAGRLPSGYYAMAEQVATRMQTDLLTLHSPESSSPTDGSGGVAVAEAAPRVRLTLRPDPNARPRASKRRARHIAIRHVSGDRVVAIIEIVSPANKDRRSNVRELADKIIRALEANVQVLLLDLLPPTKHDPGGIHSAVWHHFDVTPPRTSDAGPFTLASYAWQGTEPQAYLEPVALGQPLIDMPLFLSRDRYVYVPLEMTYMEAYRAMPERWRRVIEGDSL